VGRTSDILEYFEVRTDRICIYVGCRLKKKRRQGKLMRMNRAEKLGEENQEWGSMVLNMLNSYFRNARVTSHLVKCPLLSFAYFL
jgi:hypothetical protein